MKGMEPMSSPLGELVRCWIAWGGIDASLSPSAGVLESAFGIEDDSCRPGADPRSISAWEARHGYRLPAGLRAWLMLSDGLYKSGPLIHPLSAIGPMIPFARVPEMIVQPESWFELGNPNWQTICIDLAYRLPGGGHPVFTSGDDRALSSPRIIARSFEEWFLELLRHGGREYWFDPGFGDFGEPWESHRRFAPRPALPAPLRAYSQRVFSSLQAGADERDIAASLGLSRGDVELICRHVQCDVLDVSPERIERRVPGR
jgi:hypothetical protein